MKARLLLPFVVVMLASAARADTTDAYRFGLGLDFGVLGTPRGHLGIPVMGTEDGEHLAVAFDFRWQSRSFWAIDAGMGLAHAAIGPAVWLAGEVFTPIAAVHGDLLIVEIYTVPGLQLGFAGPDYFARQDNAFAGYAYAFGGPPSFGFRVPAGVRLRWPRARLDTYLEAVPIIAVVPSVEQFFQLTLGFRVRF